MMDEMIYLNRKFSDEELKEIAETLRSAPAGVIVPETLPIKELKYKKDIPTVIEYKGRRYVLDHVNNRK